MTRMIKLLMLMPLMCAAARPVAAQWLTLPTPGIPRTADGKPNLAAPTPRTQEGHPDLSGLWNTSGVKGDLLDATKAQPWLQALVRQREENYGKDSPEFNCLPLGPGYYMNGGMRRVLQTSGIINVLNADLTYRQIFTDGRQLERDPNPTWMGYSVGRWDADTLVVESSGFNDRTWLNNRGLSHTEALRLTERYTRPDFGHLHIDVTLTDSGAYAAPLQLAINMTLAADTELLEEVCENPRGLQQHWVGTASDAEKTAVTVTAERLAKYVGTYKGLWGRRARTVRVTQAGTQLFVTLDDQNIPVVIVPQSETRFIGGRGGLGYTFSLDANGRASAVTEEHIPGSYTYPRAGDQ